MAGKVVATKANGLAKNGVDLHWLALGRTLTGKTEETLDDFLGALRFAKDDLKFFTRGFRNLRIFEQKVGKAEDGCERVVNFVGHTGDEAADGGHFFGVGKLGLKEDGIGDVCHHDDNAVDLIGLIAAGAEADREVAHGAIAAFDAEFQIFDLLSVGGGLEGGLKILLV